MNKKRQSTHASRIHILIALGLGAITSACFCADDKLPVNSPAQQGAGRRTEMVAMTTNSVVTTNSAFPAIKRSFVKEWKVDELVPGVNKGLKGGRDFERGRKLYTELECALCHHFGPDGGGVGPDLTGAGSTFAVRDLLEAIIEPSKQISSLYATMVVRKKDGDFITGWIPEETETTVSVMESMLGDGKLTELKRQDIESIAPSQTSLMPAGFLNMLKEEEILDLVAFLLSGGDSKQKMFQKQ